MGRKRSLLRVRPPAAGALAAARPRALLACGRRAVGAAERNLTAVGEPDEAGGDHAFGRRKPALDHGLRLILLLHGDRAYRHGVVVFDHVDEGTVRAALHLSLIHI